MPILVGALISLLIAWVRGAPPLALGLIELRWLPLPLIAFGLQLIAFGSLNTRVPGPALLWQGVSMGLLLVFLLRNLRYRALGIVAAGTVLNLLVISLNGGYMPADPAALREIGLPQVAERLETRGHDQKTGRRDAATRLPRLGDVIHLPLPGPGPDRMISPGDVLVGAGVFLFLQEALVPRRRRRRIETWTAPPRMHPGSARARPTSTSPSAAPSASTATSTPTPARMA